MRCMDRQGMAAFLARICMVALLGPACVLPASAAGAPVLPMTASQADEHNRLDRIDIGTGSTDDAVTLHFTRPPDVRDLAVFTTLSPPRLVLDVPQTRQADGLPRAMSGRGLVQRAVLAGDETRLRLTLSLRRHVAHQLRVDGNTLRITLAPPATQAEPPSTQAIDFRRGAAGEARLTLTLPSAQTPVRLRQLGQTLVADVAAPLPSVLRQRVDVRDFATPVTRYAALPHDGGTRLVIEPHGLWRYHAYQRDHRLMIDVIPVEAGAPGTGSPAQQIAQLPLRPSLPASEAAPPDGKLSLNFRDIDVRSALQVLADFTGINIVASDAVSGRISLRLQDVPWQQALELILQARGLDLRRNGDILWIAPREELLARERQELEQKAKIADLEPLRAEVFQLNYQRADTFRRVFGIGEDGAALAGRRNALLSPRGSAVVDTRTNQLFVTDTLAVLANIRTLLGRIDIAARQVLIEARIVEADDNFARNLGVKLGLSARSRHPDGVAAGNAYADAAELGGVVQSDPKAPLRDPAVNLAAQAIGGSAPGSFAFTLFNAAAQRFLAVELSALETEGRGQIVSSPRVITADQQVALIEQGEEIPYQQSTAAGATTTAFKKANLKLEVTPQITPDGHVILDVDVNKDSRGTATPGGLAINTKHVRTKVQVEDGGTVVIGGIYTQTGHQREAKVPLLGDIPLLGALFRNQTRVQDKTELLIFLTPRVVAPEAAE